MRTEKRPNETAFDYHKRIIYGKLVDKTLSDFDYTELSKLIYGQAYSSDVARRMMYGSRKTIEVIDKQKVLNIKDREVASNVEDKIDELQRERQKLFDQRREYRKILAYEGRQEHLYKSLIDAANALNDTVGIVYEDLDSSIIGYENNEAVLVLSDWHYGMVTDNIFNEYNIDVCKERARTVINKAIKRIKYHKCKTLHVVILGDMIHGSIHTSARVASEELVCDQLMQVSEILAQSIDRLSRCVKDTLVYNTYGNHARVIQNKKDSIHRDNLERIIPWWFEQRFSHKENIHIVEESDNEFVFIDAAGHDICATHGDLDSVKRSPTLIPALINERYDKDIKYILLGDKHHRSSFEEMGIVASICGSLCGSDEYANSKRLFSKPSQFMLIVNPEDGVDAEYRISCD